MEVAIAFSEESFSNNTNEIAIEHLTINKYKNTMDKIVTIGCEKVITHETTS
jgi:hypothetical protein